MTSTRLTPATPRRIRRRRLAIVGLLVGAVTGTGSVDAATGVPIRQTGEATFRGEPAPAHDPWADVVGSFDTGRSLDGVVRHILESLPSDVPTLESDAEPDAPTAPADKNPAVADDGRPVPEVEPVGGAEGPPAMQPGDLTSPGDLPSPGVPGPDDSPSISVPPIDQTGPTDLVDLADPGASVGPVLERVADELPVDPTDVNAGSDRCRADALATALPERASDAGCTRLPTDSLPTVGTSRPTASSPSTLGGL